MDSFHSVFADRIGVETDSVDDVLEVLSEYVWGQVKDEGRCDIPGLGSFFVVDGKRIFEPSSELTRVVNHRYAGLSALAVEGARSEILISDGFNDSEGESDSSFEPRWEDLPEDESETVEPLDEAPNFVEETFSTELAASKRNVDSESLLSSFLGLDSHAEAAGEAKDDFAVEAGEHAESVDSGTIDTEMASTNEDLAGSETLENDSVDQVTADTLVVPIDENAEPVVAKGKPRRSPWMYALPVLAIAFIALAFLWAQTRSTTPRSVPSAVEQDAGIVSGNDDQSGETTTDDANATVETESANPVNVDPADSWAPGQINLEDGGWTIIVSSEPTEAQAIAVARELARELSDTPVPVDVLESRVNGQTRYRVAVGQYRTSTVAQRDLDFFGSRLPTGSWALRLTDNT